MVLLPLDSRFLLSGSRNGEVVHCDQDKNKFAYFFIYCFQQVNAGNRKNITSKSFHFIKLFRVWISLVYWSLRGNLLIHKFSFVSYSRMHSYIIYIHFLNNILAYDISGWWCNRTYRNKVAMAKIDPWPIEIRFCDPNASTNQTKSPAK